MIDHSAAEIMLTNGTYVDKKNKVLRRFLLLAEHEDQYWVQAMNGNYQLELLTFDKNKLKVIP